jgi:hypothetical protein
MTNNGAVTEDTQKVWRYLSFSRFIWLLQNKQLWLSRADMLGDPWEIALAGDQLAHVIARHPISPLPLSGERPEPVMTRSKRIIAAWRNTTFVNCWSASDYESHALWRVYCGANEGIALQTTFGRLRESVGGLPVYRVTYEIPGSRKQTPTLIDLVTKKRPMFAYEHEVRIVSGVDENSAIHTVGDSLGHRLDWNPEECVESIRIHPDADCSFMETASAAVQHYAPLLKDQVTWSAMQEKPPL